MISDTLNTAANEIEGILNDYPDYEHRAEIEACLQSMREVQGKLDATPCLPGESAELIAAELANWRDITDDMRPTPAKDRDGLLRFGIGLFDLMTVAMALPRRIASIEKAENLYLAKAKARAEFFSVLGYDMLKDIEEILKVDLGEEWGRTDEQQEIENAFGK